MTIRISHDCIMIVFCLKMQTFVIIRLMCRASGTVFSLVLYKLNISVTDLKVLLFEGLRSQVACCFNSG